MYFIKILLKCYEIPSKKLAYDQSTFAHSLVSLSLGPIIEWVKKGPTYPNRLVASQRKCVKNCNVHECV